MRTIIAFLYRVGFLKFTTSTIFRWTKNGNTENLILALEYGIYDIRKSTIEGLTLLRHKESIPILENSLDDPIQSVSESAMKGLDTLTNKSNRIISEKIRLKKQYWKNKRIDDKKQKANSYISNLSFNTPEKESPSQRLERRFKQQRNANHPPYCF